MKVNYKYFLSIFICMICLFNNSDLFAQDQPNYIIHLKNGSVIKGNIVEVFPDSIIKIETFDGSLFVYKYNEILNVKKNEQTVQMTKVYSPYKSHKTFSGYALFIGWAATAIGSGAMGDNMFGTTVIPIVGPFITMNRIESDPNASYLPGGKNLLTISGVYQTTFAIYYIISLIGDSNYKTPDKLSIYPDYKNNGLSMAYFF